MHGRNVSYIIDGNNTALREFVRRESWRRGAMLDLVAVHDALSPAVTLLSLDGSDAAIRLGDADEVNLQMQCGLAFTTAGPVVFLTWWVAGESGSQPLYLQNQLLPPMARSTLSLLETITRQETLFWVLAGTGGNLACVHEVDNRYPFRNLAELVRNLAESTLFSEEEFHRSCERFAREFTLEALIAGKEDHRVVFASEWIER